MGKHSDVRNGYFSVTLSAKPALHQCGIIFVCALIHQVVGP